MSLSAQPLSQEDLNLLRNDRIKFECGPFVYQTIIEWGFQKPDGVKIIDHCNNLKIVEKSDRKIGQWLKKNKQTLEKTDFSSFDITTLHDLLPVLCYEKIAYTGVKEWEEKLKDENSIEYLLKEIKSFRNDVSHEYSKAKENPNIEGKKELMNKCIRTAGALFDKDQNVIEGKITHLDTKFDELMRNTTISYENAVLNVTNLIEKESASFMREKYSPSFTVPLPGGLGKINSIQIFESVNLSVAVEDEGDTKMSKIIFSSIDICRNINNKFVIINGGPGSGKTTLTRNLFQNILDNSVNESELYYKGIDRFKVPVYLECRTERQNNLHDFLKENLPNFNSPKEVIYDAFKKVEGQVFLIDGYDEVNDRSKELVKDIIDFCSKGTSTCIVSGRVDAGNNFISILEEKKLNYNKMLIDPISELKDKLNFLRRYGCNMGNSVDSEELVESFENLNHAAQQVFFCPVLLGLFISLFLNKRDSLFRFHNEQSAYKAIRDIFFKEIEKKLRESNVKNHELRAEDMLAVLYDYSLRLFNSKKYFFEKEDFRRLMRDCEQVVSKGVDIKGLLSCILTPETSLKQDKELTYAFTHSTIQEYLAICQIIMNMRKRESTWNSKRNSEDSLENEFFECVGISTTLSDIKIEVERYGNIIKLLILETLATGELYKFTRTFTVVLRKYFTPGDYISDVVPPVFLFDLINSSNCDHAIVSVVSNVLRYRNSYFLNNIRQIVPFSEILKKKETSVEVGFDFSDSLSDSNCANFGQLLTVLKDSSKIRLDFNHSYHNHQPLDGEFYIQLKNIKCEVTEFRACVMSSKHLSIVRNVFRGDKLYISTLPACDVVFATLEGYKIELDLRVKYTNDCPKSGNNHVTARTELTIIDIPVDGRENAFNIIKYLHPISKEFLRMRLDNCHLTDIDANKLLKEVEGEKIWTKEGKRIEVKKWKVNKDKSRDLELHLPNFEMREVERREVEQREAKLLEVEHLLAEYQKAEKREAEYQKAERQENERRENERRENERREYERRENERRENERRENERRENERRENERRENERRENERRKNERRINERRENERRENEQRETLWRGVQLFDIEDFDQLFAGRLEIERREPPWREAQQREAERQEAQRQVAQRQEAQRREAERREIQQGTFSRSSILFFLVMLLLMLLAFMLLMLSSVVEERGRAARSLNNHEVCSTTN